MGVDAQVLEIVVRPIRIGPVDRELIDRIVKLFLILLLMFRRLPLSVLGQQVRCPFSVPRPSTCQTPRKSRLFRFAPTC